MLATTRQRLPVTSPVPSTIAEIIHPLEPMGDLSRFAIEDLRSEEEDEFFRILSES